MAITIEDDDKIVLIGIHVTQIAIVGEVGFREKSSFFSVRSIRQLIGRDAVALGKQRLKGTSRITKLLNFVDQFDDGLNAGIAFPLGKNLYLYHDMIQMFVQVRKVIFSV